MKHNGESVRGEGVRHNGESVRGEGVRGEGVRGGSTIVRVLLLCDRVYRYGRQQ